MISFICHSPKQAQVEQSTKSMSMFGFLCQQQKRSEGRAAFGTRHPTIPTHLVRTQ
jgi:hypothetical protein